MNQVLPPYDKNRATVLLNEIVEAPSKDELVAILAERAAAIKGSGEPDKLLRYLTTDCHIQLDRPFIEDLKQLKELRNRIVHDDTDEQITFEEVHSNFGIVLYLLYTLAQVAENYRVPCWDDVGFVHDFKDKLKADQS